MAEERVQRRLAAILAADVVGFSRLMGEDEAGTLVEFKRHLAELIRPTIAVHRGRVVKTTGDGVLAEFASAVDAVMCAREIQDRMVERTAEAPDQRRIEFRIGVNVGDILVDGDDIFGDGVNVAARLESLCEPGGVCVSGTVYDQVRGKLGLDFSDLGAQRVKNIAEPVRVYDVGPPPAPEDWDDEAEEPVAPRRRGLSRWILAIVLGVVAVNALVIWFPRQAPVAPVSDQAADVPAVRPLPDKPSIAVLPFASGPDDPLEAHLLDGITADVTAGLGEVTGLFVIAAGSTQGFRGPNVDPREAAQALGVGHVLRGSVARSADKLVLSATLVDAATGNPAWTERYEGGVSDLFELPAALVAAVARALSVELTAEEQARLAAAPTHDAAVYDLFLEARALDLADPRDAETILKARALYRQVIARDPEFAGGFAGLARTHLAAAEQGFGDAPDGDVAKALDFAKTAVALDGNFVMGRLALARAEIAGGQLDEAIASLEQTLQIAPNEASAHAALGIALAYAGRAEEGAARLREALRRDPLNAGARYRAMLGLALFAAGRFAEAITAWEEDEKLSGRGDRVLAALAAAYEASDETDKAREAKARLARVDPDFSIATYPLIAPFRADERERLTALLFAAGLPE